jgi:hypothetical protein
MYPLYVHFQASIFFALTPKMITFCTRSVGQPQAAHEVKRSVPAVEATSDNDLSVERNSMYE